MKEADLYPAVKALLEAQGYAVKGEVGPADVVAVRPDAGDDEPPVIVELKTGFSLILIHQAVDRLKITDAVYVAVPEWRGRAGWAAFKRNRDLCRRLGLGVITVGPDAPARIHCDPGGYAPRRSPRKAARLLKEFAERRGDPNAGGSARRGVVVTAYRQAAQRCLVAVGEAGPSRPRDIALAAETAKARAILADNHYGWFFRVERGVYDLTEAGRAELVRQLRERLPERVALKAKLG